MTTSEGDGLRAAILAQPDDDILRLIYADWLQENDQSDRAAFIRAQVSMAQAEPFGPQYREHARIAIGGGYECEQRLVRADGNAADGRRLERNACYEQRRRLEAQELLDNRRNGRASVDDGCPALA